MTRTLQPGSELEEGKYRIVRLLGEGGMGAVFEAEHRDTRRRVAIKCVHPGHGSEPDIAQRLVREAQAAARVRHPNVVDVYDVGRDGAMVYLVMEFLEGEPLSRPIARRDLPMYSVIAVLIDAMRGVAAVHKQGVIHRDLKPDNIFLARVTESETPVAKILDFGISKLEARGYEQHSLTRSGTTVGTPSYMSYEQLAGEAPIDARTDVYAFGVILYEALTGRLPYEADTFAELVARFTMHTPTEPSELRSDIPHTLSRVVMWALARQRDQRIPSIEALIQELEPFASRHGFEAELAQGPGPRTPAGAASGRRTPRSGSARSPSRSSHASVVARTAVAGSEAVIAVQGAAGRRAKLLLLAGGALLLSGVALYLAWHQTRRVPSKSQAGEVSPKHSSAQQPESSRDPAGLAARRAAQSAPEPASQPAHTLPAHAAPEPASPAAESRSAGEPRPAAAVPLTAATRAPAGSPPHADSIATDVRLQSAPPRKRSASSTGAPRELEPRSTIGDHSPAKTPNAPRDLGIY